MLRKEKFNISKKEREKLNNHNSLVVWLTGLSGSGKSTIANELEKTLFNKGIRSFILDGDNTRLGINSDLDFTPKSRNENIRRVAEISKIMSNAGIVVICSFISPLNSYRSLAREIIGSNNFFEVFINCSLSNCEKRDVKGLYKKARNGEIENFTGINAPFENPINADLTVDTHENNIQRSCEIIYNSIITKIRID